MADPIEDILAQFDFARVRDAMEALEWLWHDGRAHLPTLDDLRATARYCLQDVASGECDYSSTGGFTAINLHGKLLLQFVLTDTNGAEIEEGES